MVAPSFIVNVPPLTYMPPALLPPFNVIFSSVSELPADTVMCLFVPAVADAAPPDQVIVKILLPEDVSNTFLPEFRVTDVASVGSSAFITVIV